MRKRKRRRRNRIRVTCRILQNSLVFQNETNQRRTLQRVTSPSLFVYLFVSIARALLPLSTSRRRTGRCTGASGPHRIIERTVSLTDRSVEATSFLQLTPYTSRDDRDACELCPFDTCASIRAEEGWNGKRHAENRSRNRKRRDGLGWNVNGYSTETRTKEEPAARTS